MSYMNGSIKKYLKDLAARVPAPGGGSAAALASAMAAGLIAMAAEFTLGKKRYQRVAGRMRMVLRRATVLRRRLEVLCDRDIRAYRSKDLDAAAAVPAEVARLSYELAVLGQEVLYAGNNHLSTDAALAVMLAEASFIASLFYVQANIRCAVAPATKYGKVLSRLKRFLPRMKKMRMNAEDYIGTSFGW